jgi:threonine/homoserine/homoserine lactone efflux protein
LAGAFGIGVLFAAVPWLYLALKVGGGLYICWLGIKLVRGARTGTDSPPAPVSQAFRAGLLTTLSNPKTAAFVASIFALSFPRDAGALLGFVAAGLMAAISIGWYGTMAFVLGSPRAGRAYARTRAWIDRLSGGLFIALGLRLALTRATPG